MQREDSSAGRAKGRGERRWWFDYCWTPNEEVEEEEAGGGEQKLQWCRIIFISLPHMCSFQEKKEKHVLCELGMLMFRLRQQQVNRPQTTAAWSGPVCSCWQSSVRTTPPGEMQSAAHPPTRTDSDFTFTMNLWGAKKKKKTPSVLKYLFQTGRLFCSWTAVSRFHITTAKDPWKGFTKEGAAPHWALRGGENSCTSCVSWEAVHLFSAGFFF